MLPEHKSETKLQQSSHSPLIVECFKLSIDPNFQMSYVQGKTQQDFIKGIRQVNSRYFATASENRDLRLNFITKKDTVDSIINFKSSAPLYDICGLPNKEDEKLSFALSQKDHPIILYTIDGLGQNSEELKK